MNDELASIGGFKTEHRGLIDVKVSLNTFNSKFEKKKWREIWRQNERHVDGWGESKKKSLVVPYSVNVLSETKKKLLNRIHNRFVLIQRLYRFFFSPLYFYGFGYNTMWLMRHTFLFKKKHMFFFSFNYKMWACFFYFQHQLIDK